MLAIAFAIEYIASSANVNAPFQRIVVRTTFQISMFIVITLDRSLRLLGM